MSCKINFFSENITFAPKSKGKLRNWICSVVEMEGRVPGEFNFIFCDDEYLMQLNYKYLKHRTLTDIITFPVEDENSTLCGDIFISIPRVKENAGKFNQTTADELHRVMIHGILHLAGYHDKSKQEKEEMRRKENHYLEARLFT